jgi:hypothetical protein
LCVATAVTNHDVGHPDHLKVFADPELAEEWVKENGPEGVVFGYNDCDCPLNTALTLMASLKPRAGHSEIARSAGLLSGLSHKRDSDPHSD